VNTVRRTLIEESMGCEDDQAPCKVPKTEAAEPGSVKWRCRTNPTVTLSVIGLCSVRWSTVRGPNIGHFGAFLGSLKGVSGLLNGSLGLSVTVGLRASWSRAL